MTRLAKLTLTAAMVLGSAGMAAAQGGPRIPEYRPYIAEVGNPRVLTKREFEKELAVNSDLRSWVKNYGYPDVAEIQRVVPEYGWRDYEVRVFYLSYDQELAFGRVAFMPSAGEPSLINDYGLVKYQGKVQPENRKRIQYEARLCGSGGGGSIGDRVIAAADRATRAAEMAEAESLRAAAAAARAESAVGKLETGFTQSLRK